MLNKNSHSMNLFKKSKHVILENQSSTGAYIASPNFARYRYCWFRDGSYIAYAMDVVGEHESSQKFHDWAATTICNHSNEAQKAIDKNTNGMSLSSRDVLHTRYTAEGEIVDHQWANFQLDGFGTWLWALNEHIRLYKLRPITELWRRAIILTRDYISALWSIPNYDCWEENQDKVHPYTIASICAGLHAVDQLLNENTTQATRELIKQTLFTKGIYQGHLTKSFGLKAIDASLIGIAIPYHLLEPDHPIMIKTVLKIEDHLRKEKGGVHRYQKDSYYGGGEWVLLTAWLGWFYAESGEYQKASDLLGWIEGQADENLYLPEQVPTHLLHPSYYNHWLNITGKIANPLLWSHAMYLILNQALRTR